jgi:carbohydrate kinase (thermoresistant glucokinase family)
MIIIVMGVSGSGKTTVGRALAERIHATFYDADTYHPPSNIEKMSKGIPLNDDDRQPWLEDLSTLLQKSHQSGQSAVLACSALKQSYRDDLNNCGAKPIWIYLRGSYDHILERMINRPGHFMKPEMLSSQFQILEEPADALVIDAGMELNRQLSMIKEFLDAAR